MSAEHGEVIQHLEALDIAVDGRVTYHAVEWIDAVGGPCVEVCSNARLGGAEP